MQKETKKKLTNANAYQMLTGEEKSIYQAYVMRNEGITNRTTFYNGLKKEITLSHMSFLNTYFGFTYDRETGELSRIQNRKNYEELKEKIIADGLSDIQNGLTSCSRLRGSAAISA